MPDPCRDLDRAPRKPSGPTTTAPVAADARDPSEAARCRRARRWHSSCYRPRVASRVVRARLDGASERALSTLMREGRNESEAVRAALVEAGERRRRQSALAEEVRRLAEDPADTAERRAVMADMDAVSADWPA